VLAAPALVMLWRMRDSVRALEATDDPPAPAAVPVPVPDTAR
jgi:hypothetical protein